MAKLQITAEHREMINQARNEWLAVGISTDPADFDTAKAAIARLYERIDLKRPHFVTLSSPLGAEIYLNLLCSTRTDIDQKIKHEQLRGQLHEQLGGQLREQLREQLRGQELKFMDTWLWGQWDSYFWGWVETGRRLGVAYPPELDATLDNHCAIARSIGWWYPFSDFCIITDRPDIISRDSQARMHSDSGPALHYRDGYALYAAHGVRVEPWIIEQPEKITDETISEEKNAEVRRMMIERYGPDKYLLDSGAEAISHDETGILYRKELEDDEPIVMVRLLNSTPEPDGVLSRDEAIAIFGAEARAAVHASADARFKQYMLRVPPDIRTAREAVAWTFGIEARSYAPEIES